MIWRLTCYSTSKAGAFPPRPGTATRAELDARQAGVADHDAACVADGEPVHSLNLDCMASPAEVAEVATHLATLRAYADAKAWAMTFRLGGNIAGALALESDCEHLYGQLPAALALVAAGWSCPAGHLHPAGMFCNMVNSNEREA